MVSGNDTGHLKKRLTRQAPGTLIPRAPPLPECYVVAALGTLFRHPGAEPRLLDGSAPNADAPHEPRVRGAALRGGACMHCQGW